MCVGKYIILFQDVILTFLSVSIVFVIMIIGFAFGFHILLSNREEFKTPYDALLKSFMMMSGEIDYGEIFFMDNPPEGFGDKYDQGHEKVPFPVITYAMFLVFLFLVSIVAINVLVGLTVDDIRNFLENADLLKLSMRLRYILAMERGSLNSFMKRCFDLSEDKETFLHIKKNREMAVTNDLISKAKIWEKIEKKQEERRQKGEAEQEKLELKEFMKEQNWSQTRKLKNLLVRKANSTEHAEPNESVANSTRRSTFFSRQKRSSILEFEDDETNELPQRSTQENERLKSENRRLKVSLKEIENQKDAEIKRLQANSRNFVKMQNQKDVEIRRLQDENKNLNEIRNDLKSIVRHLTSVEEGKDERISSRL